jgi:hypothetical protein
MRVHNINTMPTKVLQPLTSSRKLTRKDPSAFSDTLEERKVILCTFMSELKKLLKHIGSEYDFEEGVTEEIFMDKSKELIYSCGTVSISAKSGILYCKSTEDHLKGGESIHFYDVLRDASHYETK